MRIFLDTANVEQIEWALAAGCLSGVTTNPTIIAREQKSLSQCISDIVAIDPSLTLLIEAVSAQAQDLAAEARELTRLAPNAVIKLPMTYEGLAAIRILSPDGIRTAVTLVFSLNQAVAASCAGADYVAPFVGRLDDINADGVEVVRSIKEAFHAHGVSTQVIAASVRTPQRVGELFAAGADVVTMPASILRVMLKHPLTDAGLARFAEDWSKVPGKT